MTTLPDMGLVLPTRGPSGAGIWDDTLDADLALVDAHDHTTGKGQPINTAAIAIDADLSFSSLWAPTNLHRIQFASVVGFSGNNKSLFVSLDNELYWRSNAGANVQITTGSTLNVAAFTGGIGGDYAAVGAAVAYDDAGDRYTFKQQSPGNWARLASGEVRIFETGTTESVFVGLAAPAALASSYTVTFPLAPPASTLPVQMSSTGVLTAGRVSETWTFPPTLAITGAGVSITASTSTLAPAVNLLTSTAISNLPFMLPVGSIITSWSMNGDKTSGSGTITAKLFSNATNTLAPGKTQIGSTQTNAVANPGAFALGQSGLSTTVASNTLYFIEVTGGGVIEDKIYGWSITASV